MSSHLPRLACNVEAFSTLLCGSPALFGPRAISFDFFFLKRHYGRPKARGRPREACIAPQIIVREKQSCDCEFVFLRRETAYGLHIGAKGP